MREIEGEGAPTNGTSALTVAALALTMLVGCGGAGATSPSRSPGNDYGQPSPTTSQGETVGADGVSPADKLTTGPSVGTEGTKPAATPAAVENKKKPAPP